MSDENMNTEEQLSPTVKAIYEQTGGPQPRKKRNKKLIVGVIIVVLVAVGAGMLVWHESPTFCSTMCHIEGTYVDNYTQEQNTVGRDKYGNLVTNTNAMLAVLHRETKATAKPEMVCVDCHEPNFMELAHDGLNYVLGNYPLPRDERSASRLQSWDKKTSESFCANEGCHVYLLGDNGELDYNKLEKSTQSLVFNPHEQHHEALSLECSDCHKAHRASTLVCTACHEHESVALPDGWLTYDESEKLMQRRFAG